MTISERDRMTALVPGIGLAGIQALQAAQVLVVGAGGLGSPVLAYLAAAGVGTIGISDPDRVEVSNLQRQVIHSTQRIGQIKSASAAKTVRAINPHIEVRIEDKITSENALKVLRKYQIVVDASDNFPTKYLLSDKCKHLQIPHVWGTLVGMEYQVSIFAKTLSLRDLYPTAPQEGTTPTSAQLGVLGAVCGQAGAVMATEAIKWITNLGQPLWGKVLIGQAAWGQWDVVPFSAAKQTETDHSATDQSISAQNLTDQNTQDQVLHRQISTLPNATSLPSNNPLEPPSNRSLEPPSNQSLAPTSENLPDPAALHPAPRND